MSERGNAVCQGCGEAFDRQNHDAQWVHALREHGGVDAVSFDLVPAYEVVQ